VERVRCGLIKKLELSLNRFEGIKVAVDERFKEIRSLKTEAKKSLKPILKEADFVQESLEELMKEFEEMVNKFNAFQQDKKQKLEVKERELSVMRNELLEEIKLKDEKLVERLEEIESREIAAQKSLSDGLKEADLIRESLEKGFNEFEIMETDFNAFRDDKLQSLESKEQQLRVMRIELLDEVQFREEKLTERTRWRNGSKSLRKWKKNLIYSNMTTRKLELEEQRLSVTRIVLLKEQQKLAQHLLKCLEKMVGKKKKMRELEVAGDKLRLIKEELSLDVNFREEKFDKQEIGAKEIECISIKDCVQEEGVTVEPVDPRCEVHDRIIVELFMHNTEKDLEFFSDEVFKVLLRSSDPAKLILEAVVLFCAPPYVKDGDIKIDIQERGIVLLDQLTKMSPDILRCGREAAILVANAWTSKMRTSAENPLNVLGFLHFLAAYKISSCFDKDEIFGFLKSVAEHNQTPGLFRALGLTENIPGFIQTLINEKHYLLVSTYIYECQLETMFPQTASFDPYGFVVAGSYSASGPIQLARGLARGAAPSPWLFQSLARRGASHLDLP
ncbi:hypothetical protein MIMGU_mgv1a023489mg, partial [Erythranthe guttata]